MYREFCAVIARSTNQVDVEFLPKGLHDAGREVMSEKLQETLAAVDQSDYDAVLMGYGLCSNGLVGLSAGSVPLVIPRAHDCITLFLGSKERYLEYFYANTGAYFKTSGWLERGNDLKQYGPDSIQEQSGMNQTYDDMVEKYGADNAKFLWEQLCEMTHNYGRLTFIEMGVEPNDSFERQAKDFADEREWKFEKVAGDMALMYLAHGGVYLAGDILLSILEILKRSRFRDRFENKGRGTAVVAQIPTFLITNKSPVLLGCARLLG